MGRLDGKAILVTGSTTGIGEAIARRCLAEGARVLLHGRDRARGEALVAELGERACLHVDDLEDPAAAGRLAAAAEQAFGALDALVNNAAWVVRSSLETTSADFFDRVMRINVRAPMLLIQATLPQLARTRGCVLNIGSINGYCGEPRQLDYSMSKGALMTMSRNLADALSPRGVRVNHFNVGWVLTPNEYQLKISEGLAEDWPSTLDRYTIPSGKMTRPEDIAAHAAFWVSDDSRPMSGSVLELEQYPFIGRNPLKEGDD